MKRMNQCFLTMTNLLKACTPPSDFKLYDTRGGQRVLEGLEGLEGLEWMDTP